MQPFFQFLLRFNGVLALVLLGALTSYVYFNRNVNERKLAFLSSANNVSGRVYEYSSWMWRYWNLSVVNDSLARENVRLRMMLPNARYAKQVEHGHYVDSLSEQAYDYTAATVVHNSINKPRNFLTINRGRAHGIRPGTGVADGLGQGLVGIVHRVTTHYASVMSVFNKDTRISAKVQGSQYFGILVWGGEAFQHLDLEAVPKHAELHKGDTVVTSGYSTIFPKGILVGTIDTFYILPGSNFYTAKVRLFNDLSNVQQVYVIDDLHSEEKDSLKAMQQ